MLKGYRLDDVDGVIVACDVPPLVPTMTDVVREYFKVEPLLVGHGLRTGVRILYENPKGLGSDRIVDAVAAIHLYGAPVIVVDFGTGTVFDAINTNGDYLGGAIAGASASPARPSSAAAPCSPAWPSRRRPRPSAATP
ncbi:MAG: type III pantothenate kinase [Dehalococcoidia bacterium]|nr:type III pantothenate kinase [Dehalococcoidia bacterium]